MLRPTHVPGHTLNLVLLPSDSGADDLNVLSLRSNVSAHDMAFFHVNFPKTYSFKKFITFRKYQKVADASLYHSIEQTLNGTTSFSMSAHQLVYIHNYYFSSLSTELCTKVNIDIIIRDNSQWYDTSIVNLRCQRKRAKSRWCRVG